MEAIKLVPKEQAPVNVSVVERLEAALEKAKNGEFAGVCIVAVNVNGTNYSTFSAQTDRLRMVGLLDWVKFRLLEEYNR